MSGYRPIGFLLEQVLEGRGKDGALWEDRRSFDCADHDEAVIGSARDDRFYINQLFIGGLDVDAA